VDKTTAALFSGIALMGVFPLVTSIADMDDDTQALIRTGSWGLAATIAIAAAIREESQNVREQRLLEDGKTNSRFMLQRQANINHHAAAQLRLDIAGELEQVRIAQSVGNMGFKYMPQEFHAFTTHGQSVDGQIMEHSPVGLVPKTAPPPIVPGSLALSPGVLSATANGQAFDAPSSEFSPDYIKAAYQYLLSLQGRNTLNTLIYGRTGDTKTSLMHRMFYEKLLLEPDSVLLVCDRKNMSSGKPGSENWQSNWFGAPVYPDAGGRNSIDILTKSPVPFTHVYASVSPRLDLWCEWIYNYVETWRLSGRMDTDGEFIEMTMDERRKDPLWSKTYDRPRPIYIIADDGTSILQELDNSQKSVANEYLNKLCTLGRSENVHVIWCAHSNTQTDVGLSGPAMDSMAIVQGASFASNSMRTQYNRETVQPEGVERCLKDEGKKAKGFATSFSEFPYIPPSVLSEKDGLRGYVIPDIAIEWLQNIPVPHYLKPWHKEILAAKGFTYERGVGVVKNESVSIDNELF
jgi:hypothetical protein